MKMIPRVTNAIGIASASRNRLTAATTNIRVPAKVMVEPLDLAVILEQSFRLSSEAIFSLGR